MNQQPDNQSISSMRHRDGGQGGGNWPDLLAFLLVLATAIALVVIVVHGQAGVAVLSAAAALIVAVYTAWRVGRR